MRTIIYLLLYYLITTNALTNYNKFVSSYTPPASSMGQPANHHPRQPAGGRLSPIVSITQLSGVFSSATSIITVMVANLFALLFILVQPSKIQNPVKLYAIKVVLHFLPKLNNWTAKWSILGGPLVG